MNSLAALDLFDDLATPARRSLVVARDEGDQTRDRPLETIRNPISGTHTSRSVVASRFPFRGGLAASLRRSQRLGEPRSGWARGLMAWYGGPASTLGNPSGEPIAVSPVGAVAAGAAATVSLGAGLTVLARRRRAGGLRRALA